MANTSALSWKILVAGLAFLGCALWLYESTAFQSGRPNDDLAPRCRGCD